MKANELRIGNYISRLDLGDQSIRIEIVLELRTDKALTSGPVNVMIPYSEIKPVEITKNHLLNFGFVQVQNDHLIPNHIAFEKDNFHIKIYNETDKVKVWYKESVIDNVYFYIHEIQNLYFAHTKEELIFKK